MKFSVSVGSFTNAISKLSPVIPTRSPLPILDNVLFDLTGDDLMMFASDLEIFISTKLKIKNKKDDSKGKDLKIAIPGKKLHDLLRTLLLEYDKSIISAEFDKKIFEEIKDANVFDEKLKYHSAKQLLMYEGLLTEAEKINLEEIVNSSENLNIEHRDILLGAIAMLYDKSMEILGQSELDISIDNKNRVTLKTKKGKYNLSGQPGEDFPTPEIRNDLNKINLDGKVLRRFISKIIHAVNKDELKRNMSGILFDISKNELKLVATDGFRLGKIVNKNLNGKIDGELKLIVPLKTCNLILRLNKGEDTTLEYNEDDLKISFDEVEIYSKLIDEGFPNYENVIPKDNDKILKINKNEFANSLRRAIIFADNVTKRVRLEISNDKLTIKEDSPETGAEGEETLECRFVSNESSDETDYDKEPFVIAFNAGYLLDAVSQMETDEINISFGGSSKAAIATPSEQQKSEDFLELIMPVRVS